MSHQLNHNGSCVFTVWAPEKESMVLHLVDAAGPDIGIAMQKNTAGYFQLEVERVRAGDRYFYRPEGQKDYPDPESYFQPEGIHGPSAVVDHDAYVWKDSDWKGFPFNDFIFYELHVGAFTPEGTFTAIISRLDDLAATGINAIELMPVAQCSGARNWGYDGVFLYAVQNSYGNPDDLKQLVDACHQRGIAVFLDVVYNHLGREGNYLPFFGPYFTETYRTPWGKAFNYDGAWSDGVKDFVIGNVLYWAQHYHIDGLRLDAIHEIYDRNATTLWDLLQAHVREWEHGSGRRLYLVAESDLNSPRVVGSTEAGGLGFDAQWLDDFHHALYVLLDEKAIRHYRDFGLPELLAKAYTHGFVHSGEYVDFRHRKHGADSSGIPGDRFIVFNQNHDLPGNRPGGERLSVLVDFARLKLAAAAVLLSPYIPLLFMGEEYGEDAPFYFFSDYEDKEMAAHLQESRKKQFADFDWEGSPLDSQPEEVFLKSKLHWEKRGVDRHRLLLEWHRQLIHLRKTNPLFQDLSQKNIRADLLGKNGLAVHRHSADHLRRLLCLFNFSKEDLHYTFSYPEDSPWEKLLDSGDIFWLEEKSLQHPMPEMVAAGSAIHLSPWSVVVYEVSP
jgi:maltooligosyltrehalose trehalohydrolase